MTHLEKSQKWLESPLVSDEDKEVIKHASNSQLEDMFYRDLEFGTAGMRGIIGPGSNRMNILTVRKATIGFAKYLIQVFGLENARNKGVCIACDNRHQSAEFVKESSLVLNDFGIDTFVFDELRPTPELSFAVSHLHAVGGIMITASHNPKEYNGYKVYDEYGCQLVPSKTDILIPIINSLGSETDASYEVNEERGHEHIIGEEVDRAFLNRVYSISLNTDEPKKVKIVFTPQHGTSYKLAMKLFNHYGYEVYPVLSQCTFDPEFSNTLSPNPELKEAYTEALKLAKEVKADLVLTTDPDADRVGVAFLNSKGEYELHTGNQTGSLLIDYVFKARKEKGLLPNNSVMCNTVVTSSLGAKIAKNYGVETVSFLTGFKYIGEAIEKYNQTRKKSFQFGYEESYGYIFSDFCRDKDSLEALLMIAEMTNHYLLLGKRLDEVLNDLYKEYGYHINKLYNRYFEGSIGFNKMTSIMQKLRDEPLKELAGIKIVKTEDYYLQVSKENGVETVMNSLPQANVIKCYLEDGSWFACRPSGTEPKCKFYFEAIDTDESKAINKPQQFFKSLINYLEIE